MAGTLSLELLTPQKMALEIQASEATLPGKLGEFTILTDHAPYVAQLKPGILRYSGEGGSGALVIGSGFAEVVDNRLLVLTRSVDESDSLDGAELKASLEEAVRHFDSLEPGDAGYISAGEEVQRLRAGLELLSS